MPPTRIRTCRGGKKPTGASAAFFFSVLLAAISVACNPQAGEVLPQAYIAPASVNLRSQLNQKNSTVAILTHGQQVGIVEVRRRYAKIRTQKGVEGWVDSLDLLSPEEMQKIRREREKTLRLPSEGEATAFETLNIHLAPNRRSPAFAKIAEGAPVSVIGRTVVPRNAPVEPYWPRVERTEPQRRKGRKGRASKTSSRQPPRPAPPGLPPGWQETWGISSHAEEEARSAPTPKNEPSKTRPSKKRQAGEQELMDAWTLIRTENNQTGWVLSRNLVMSIPDEVAQYAEGKHITSYFDLGAVDDERDGVKHNWLWTTASVGQAADFDGWRVFVWNRRRHHYETSYRQRTLQGYFPVHVDPPGANSFGRTFSLIMKDDDGRLRRRTYLFDGERVHLTKTEDYPVEPLRAAGRNQDAARARGNWLARQWTAVKERLFGAK